MKKCVTDKKSWIAMAAMAAVLAMAGWAAADNTQTWSINSPKDATVSLTGTGGHLLKMESINIAADVLKAGIGGTLDIVPVAEGFTNTTRRFAVWTDLSENKGGAKTSAGGTTALPEEDVEIDNITFATSANIAAGQVVFTAANSPRSIAIPKEMLYNAATNTPATTVYFIITTDVGTNATNAAEGADRATRTGNNRGAAEFVRFGTVTLNIDVPSDLVDREWTINPAGADPRVSRMGTGDHLLKLSDVTFDPANLPANGGVLSVAYTSAGNNSTRRISAWTDLSGDKPAIEDITFATSENFGALKIASEGGIGAGDLFADITIPQALLYDADAKKYATEIYVILHTNNTTAAATAGDNRGAAEFVRFATITLNVAEASKFTSHITLTPGATAAEMNFAWFTKAGAATPAVLQLMPGTPAMTPFTGVNAAGAHGFRTNKVTVTGLASNTTYSYRVGDGNDGNWSNTYTFSTYNHAGGHSVIAVADPQIGSSGDRGQWLKTITAAVAKAKSDGSGPAFMLTAGDQTNYANDIGELDGYLAPPELKSLPVAVTIGNHDVVDMRIEPLEQAGFMDKVYNWPNHSDLKNVSGIDQSRLRAGGDYYFSYGNTLYISINSQITNASMHETFMTAAIASHPDAAWKVAFFHHDIYGGGSHASPKGYSDSYNMQASWSPFLDKHGINLAINGHDHVYARSRFMKGNTIMKEQMPTVLDADETNLTKPNPGVFIQPNGIQYMALSGATAKFYALEMQPWVAYGHEQETNNTLNNQYSIITVDGESLKFSTYRAEDDLLIDEITLKKTANRSDLTSLIPGMKSVLRNAVTETTWDAFQQSITDAEGVRDNASATAAAIHSAYVGLYDAYYGLDPATNKTALGDLIDVVTKKLATSSEGRWEGQYGFGSKEQVQPVLDAAAVVYDLRLATQAAIDKARGDLDAAYKLFLATESTTPVPFVFIHEIKANEAYTIDLVDWMKPGDPFFFGEDPKEHYDAHFTKQVYSKDTPQPMRSDEMYGPANKEGGRGHNGAHITTTHIGEWIRYELNVEQAGSYKAALGAANPTASAQTVVLRDDRQNILSTFTIAASTPLTGNNWNSAGQYDGDEEFYLPAGKSIIELFFVNAGRGVDGSATANTYPAGPDVDILTLERVGDMAAPVVIPRQDIWPLSFVPTTTGGAVNRQRGWSTDGAVWEGDGGSTASNKGLPVNVLKGATHLVMELAGQPSSSSTRSIQVNIMTETLHWSQAEPNLNSEKDGMFAIWDANIGPFGALVFNLENLVFTDGGDAYQALKNMSQRGRIVVGYYSYGWEELNVMKSYLRVTGGTLAVKAADRVIPDAGGEAAAVPAAGILSGEFTAGPNIVDKQSGSVNFFYKGRQVKNAQLSIYDASGNFVQKIKISDNATASPSRRVVGSWNLKNSNGRIVSEGTYIVKGALIGMDGSKYKVSLLVGVR